MYESKVHKIMKVMHSECDLKCMKEMFCKPVW